MFVHDGIIGHNTFSMKLGNLLTTGKSLRF